MGIDCQVPLVNIYGDESSQNAHRYMVLGTIWENPVCAADLERDIQNLRRATGFNKEFHWTDIKGHQIKAYKGLIEIFKEYMDQGMLKFRALVVDQTDARHKVYSSDDELHFYKMYFWLIYKNLRDEHKYDILLDRKNTSVPGRLSDLKNTLNNKFMNDYWMRHRKICGNVVRRVEARDGSQIELQLVDVFTGAIAFLRNQDIRTKSEKNAKAQLIFHMWDVLDMRTFLCHSSYESPNFNIWCFKRK